MIGLICVLKRSVAYSGCLRTMDYRTEMIASSGRHTRRYFSSTDKDGRDWDCGISSGDGEKRKNSRQRPYLVENCVLEMGGRDFCHSILICLVICLFMDCKLLEVRTLFLKYFLYLAQSLV